MAEETVVAETKQEEVVETPQVSEVEAKAMEAGWRPKEQWEADGKDPAEWRSAKEFNERGEFFKTIHQIKRELKQKDATISAMQKHHQYVFDQAFRKAQAELRKERREALRNDDIDRVEQIETQLQETEQEYNAKKQEMVADQQAAQAAGPHPEFQAWLDKNDWYSTDEDLRDFADAAGLVYTKKNPGVQPEVVLSHVEKVVKQKFPEKFGQRKAAPNAVASVNRAESGRKKAGSEFEMSDMEKDIMKTFVRGGVMTEAEYIAELKKSRS